VSISAARPASIVSTRVLSSIVFSRWAIVNTVPVQKMQSVL
jgi:hypothetical protein